METQSEQRPIETNEQIEVGFFRPGDAKGIIELFKAVYGERYPIKVFYDEKALTDANAEGEYYSMVARTDSGKVVGVQHLFRSAPYKSLYETGAGLVLKESRQLGLNKRMMKFIYNEWVPDQDNIQETFGEAVCNHPYMQRVVSQMGHVETALEIALMPTEAYDKEQSATGRVAGLLVFRCYKPKPHAVFLPSAYESELRWIYSRLDDQRNLAVADKSLPADISTKAEMTVFDFAQVARIAIHESGHDLAEYLTNLENQAVAQRVVVIQVWLKLNAPWSGSAVDILRSKGYFLGGVLPRWFDEDGLLMQKLLCDPDFDGIQLYSDEAKEIFTIVKEDWTRAKALSDK
jgi:hypothetical protein